MSGFGFDLDAVLANMREQFDALKAENDALKNQLEAVKAERDAFERKYRLLAHHACNTVINKENQLKAANQEISRQKDWMEKAAMLWFDSTSRISELERQLRDKNNGF